MSQFGSCARDVPRWPSDRLGNDSGGCQPLTRASPCCSLGEFQSSGRLRSDSASRAYSHWPDDLGNHSPLITRHLGSTAMRGLGNSSDLESGRSMFDRGGAGDRRAAAAPFPLVAGSVPQSTQFSASYVASWSARCSSRWFRARRKGWPARQTSPDCGVRKYFQNKILEIFLSPFSFFTRDQDWRAYGRRCINEIGKSSYIV
jgi:hypothetical protein